MLSTVHFASVAYDKYDKSATLPSKFGRMLSQIDLSKMKGKSVAIKMHVGRAIGFTTIHPLFVKILVDHVKALGGKPFITDQSVRDARVRGYTEEYLGCPIVDVCGLLGKYFYPRDVDYKNFKNVDVGGHIHDADYMIDLSHVKGHGSCGYGGACKNIAMGCVTDRTRSQIHNLEGGISWDKEKCTHCELCVSSCNHDANYFEDDEYTINFHHCTFCQHCVKVCPTGAITMNDSAFDDFQTGMALCTSEVLKAFDLDHVYYINFMTNITALCDCWGLSTPALVPDIGIVASSDIVAIERSCLDMIKTESFIPSGAPEGYVMGKSGHLFERLHGKNPFVQLDKLQACGLGSQKYDLVETK